MRPRPAQGFRETQDPPRAWQTVGLTRLRMTDDSTALISGRAHNHTQMHWQHATHATPLTSNALHLQMHAYSPRVGAPTDAIKTESDTCAPNTAFSTKCKASSACDSIFSDHSTHTAFSAVSLDNGGFRDQPSHGGCASHGLAAE